MQRIGIDARMMGAENTRGIGRYIEECVRGMLPLLRENETLVLFERDPDHSPIRDARVQHVKADIAWYGFAEQLRFPRALKEAKIDALWVPHWNIPLMYRGRLAVTIHDLLLISRKKSAKISTKNPFVFWTKYAAFLLVLRAALAKAKIILPPTKAVRDEIRLFYPPSAEKLRVTGEGVAHLPKPGERPMPEPYLFYVGSAYPHKRLDLALDAWNTISKNHPDLHFVIGGEKDVFMKRYEAMASERALPRIRFVGTLTDDELASYLAHAEGFVFPSEYEGFGLPPLEAILAGTPAVSADIPVMKEVLPETGVFFFHKGDVNDMISAIESILERGKSDGEMDAAAAWARERHDWSKTASVILDSIREAGDLTHHHGAEKGKTRGASGMEEDESQSRAGTPA